MFDNIHFYCHYGNGDIFIAREFVKKLCELIPADNFYFAHAKNKRILADMPFLKWEPITDKHVMRSYIRPIGKELYVNTWLGVTSKYVTKANSCSINNAFRMFNDFSKSLGFDPLPGTSLDYLPQPLYTQRHSDGQYYKDFEYDSFQLDGVREFVKDNPDFIIIDNCFVQSNQAENFDFSPVIENVASDHSELLFVVTNRLKTNVPNIIYTGDITKVDDGFDLNEISYLSTFTDYIIGRSSGPMVFCMTRDNCYNPKKHFLSFTYRSEASHIIDQGIKMPCEIGWSDSTKAKDVEYIINDFLERKSDE
jgi:hypothetical protein